MDGNAWLEEIREQYAEYKNNCERAAAQVSDEDFFATLGRAPLSLAVQFKHVGGNHRSRWRDFLTADGEKRDRDRDSEFTAEGETRASVLAKWDAGWQTALDTLSSLTPAGLERTITIYGEPLPVVRAIHRNLAHVVYHTGQIVLLARHFAGDAWQTLSIAPGKTAEHHEQMRERFGDWWKGDAGSG